MPPRRGRPREPSPPAERRRTRSGRRSRSPVQQRVPLPGPSRQGWRDASHGNEPAARDPSPPRRDPTPPPPRGQASQAAGQPQDWWEPEPQQQQHADSGLLAYLLKEVETLKNQILMKGDLIDALHLTVPLETQEKIWAGKFVDLSTLLVKNYQKLDEDEDKKLCGIQDKEGNITLKNVKKKKNDLTIDQWSSAFSTFMSVYLLRHNDELQDMLAYFELIRGAARDHPNSLAWRNYDELFRTKKASDPTRPWGMVDNQLWLALFCKSSKANEVKKFNRLIQSQILATFSTASRAVTEGSAITLTNVPFAKSLVMG